MASTTLQFLNANSGAIQAIATVILVIVTYWYARLTRSAVSEASSARLDARLPIIDPLELRGPIKNTQTGERLEIHLKNIGYGPALDVRLVLPNGVQQDIGNLAEEETGWYGIPMQQNELQKIADLPKLKRTINIKYFDVFSREVVSLVAMEVNHHDNGSEKWFTLYIETWHLFNPDNKTRGLLMPSSYIDDLLPSNPNDKE